MARRTAANSQTREPRLTCASEWSLRSDEHRQDTRYAARRQRLEERGASRRGAAGTGSSALVVATIVVARARPVPSRRGTLATVCNNFANPERGAGSRWLGAPRLRIGGLRVQVPLALPLQKPVGWEQRLGRLEGDVCDIRARTVCLGAVGRAVLRQVHGVKMLRTRGDLGDGGRRGAAYLWAGGRWDAVITPPRP